MRVYSTAMDLVTGPFHPDLERAFAETLRDLKRDRAAPVAVVAPSQRMSSRLKELAIEACPSGVAAVRFFNLYSFARSLLPAPPVLDDPLVAEKLVLDLVESRFAKEPYLSGASRIHRTARGLLSVIHDLQDGCLDSEEGVRLFVEELREALAGGGGKTLAELDSPRLAEVLSLFHYYEAALRERKLLDRHQVAQAAAHSKFSLPFSRVLYYGFYELVQSQVDLLKAVCGRVPVTVFYPYVDAPAFAFAKEFYASILRPMTKDVRILPAEPMTIFDPDRRPADLVARTYTVSGLHDELWIAAKEIVRWRDQGVKRIGVVARTLDPYVEILEPVFAAHAIPFTTSAERSLARDPSVKALRRLLTLHERDYSREDVMDFLSSPHAWKPEGSNPVAWDLRTRERGIGHGESEWRSRLKGADPELRKALDRLFSVGRPPEQGTWAALAAWVRKAIDELLVDPAPEIAAAMESLDRIAEVRPRPKPGEFRDTLATILERLKRPVGGDAGVQVLDAMAARGIPFDRLVILGMNERVFPRYILQDPFLRDEVRSRLYHRLGNRLPRKTDGYEEEKLLFALLLASAGEVVIVRRRSDEQGRVQVPSIFLSALQLPAPVDVPRQPKRRLEMDVPLTPREASVLEHFRPGAAARVRPLAERRGWPVERLDRASDFLAAIAKFGAPGWYDGHVGEMKEYAKALGEHGISPTALETLAECGFKYFAKQVVDLAPLDEPEAEDSVDVLEAGTVYHRALEISLKEKKKIDEAFRLACGEFEERRTVRYPLLWEIERERMSEALRAFLAEDESMRGDFRPAEFEVLLEGEIGGIKFHGKADRIDVKPRAFRVVDYKRSKSRKYQSKIDTGIFEKHKFFQLPIYFLLAAQKYRDADLEKSAACYGFIEDEPEFKELDGSFLERRKEFEELVKSFLAQIRAGKFGLKIDDHCGRCDFRFVCRRNHIPTRRRASHD